MKMTLKRPYEKPTMTVYQMGTTRLICTSGDPNWRNIPGGPDQF